MSKKIIVKSVRDSFRRAGLQFTREGVTLHAKHLTEQQLEAIYKEPALSVSDAPDDKSAEKANSEAVKREKKVTSTKEGKAAWEAASAAVRAERQLDDDAWAKLADAERIELIEAKLAEGTK